MLKVNSLSHFYNGVKALDDVSFELHHGEFLGLIGPNGAGKTTLLRNIAGLLKPQSGEIIFDDHCKRETSQAQWAKRVAMLPQGFCAPSGFLVEEIVLMGRLPHSKGFFENGEDHKISCQAMRMAGIEDFARRPVNTLSGGEYQRVLIAKALAQEPELLLLDEPTASLDIKHQSELFDLMTGLAAERKITIVASLHNINMAILHSDKLLMLKKGKMIEWGEPNAIISAEILREVYDAPISVMRSDDKITVVA